ncbi:MAG: carboxyl transferase domain-containing protein [Actinomycetota bacterium]|nr:carboxyl transferase domain-containing protein [Actinomycetota bacterium]
MVTGGRMERIAVAEQGIAAMRLIAAVAELDDELGSATRTIALHTAAARGARSVRAADEAFEVGRSMAPGTRGVPPATIGRADPADRVGANGSAAPAGRVLGPDGLSSALVAVRADTLWPGGGAPAGDAAVARRCAELGVTFLGPDAEVITRANDRVAVRHLAEAAGVTVLPWSGGPVTGADAARAHAARLGGPVVVRPVTAAGPGDAVAVGGPVDVDGAFVLARARAASSGDDAVLVESAAEGMRRLSVPFAADHHGTVRPIAVIDRTVRRDRRVVLAESPPAGWGDDVDAKARAAAATVARALGYVGVGSVEVVHDPGTDELWFVGVDPRLPAAHAVAEAVSGIDLVKLQLRIGHGLPVDAIDPSVHGVALGTTIRTEAAPGAAPATGRAQLGVLRVPVGGAVRIETSVEEGDLLPPGGDEPLVEIVAGGSGRAEAHARLRRALRDTTVLVRRGATDKEVVARVLAAAEPAGGTTGTDGEAPVPHADVALVAAAVAAHRAQSALDIGRFRSAAARGRPRIDDEPGRVVELRHDGASYRFTVSRTGPDELQVEVDGAVISVTTGALGGAGGERLTLGTQSYRVTTDVDGATHLIDVDGHVHRVVHDEAGVVRAPSPAVVVSVAVGVGEVVAPGDQLAVVEAMKMETAITAAFAGTVREVRARPNTQVPAGAPLLVIDPADVAPGARDGRRVDLSALAASTATDQAAMAHDRCRHQLEALRRLLAGYDVDPADIDAMADGDAVCDEPLDPIEQVELEEEILGLFVDVISLFRRVPADEPLGDAPVPDGDARVGDATSEGRALGELDRRSTEEHLFAYLRRIEARGEGLPGAFVDQLRATLARFGITDLEPTPRLEEALCRIVRSHQRMDRQVAPVVAVLEHRLDHPVPGTEAGLAGLLDRVVGETRHRYPTVHDLAVELRYRNVDQPFLERVRIAALEDARHHMDALAADPVGPEREMHIAALVACSQPLKTELSRRFVASGPVVRGALLEAMTRRYYRIRDLEKMATGVVDGFSFASAEYDLDGTRIHVFSTHVEGDELAAGAEALRPALAGIDRRDDAVLDVYAWRTRPVADHDAARAEMREALSRTLGELQLRRIVVALSTPDSGPELAGVVHFTFRPDGAGGYRDDHVPDMHPMMAKRLQLWRLDAFDLDQVPTPPDVYLFRGRARENERDERLFALAEIRDLTAVRDETGAVQRLPELERVFREVLGSVRRYQAHHPSTRHGWNRIILYGWPPLDLSPAEMRRLAERMAPGTAELGIEKVLLLASVRDPEGGIIPRVFDIANPTGDRIVIRVRDRADQPLQPLDDYGRKVVSLRRRGLVHPYELVRMLAPPVAGPARDRPDIGEPAAGSSVVPAPPGTLSPGTLPPGRFEEHDLDGDRLVPVDRAPGENTANVVCGVITNITDTHPEGMRRVILLGDPTRGMGSLSEPECRRIMAAMDLADELGVPLEWFAVSAGALISMDSGTENMDWIARVLRRIIEFTQAGGELNVVVTAINVGAQPYWNAEATMLMHTRGILVMTPEGAMVLTGKDALEYSGGVSAEDNLGIGGYERIMGPNGQAQYLARDLPDACRILLRHYDHTYVTPGERFPRRAETTDPADRDVCSAPHGGEFATVGEIFSAEHNPERKRPFEIRRVMAAAVDRDHPTLERWFGVEDAEIAVVWDAHLGGHPVCLLGMESKNLPRVGYLPADGPEQWTAGTLFPMGSKKVARAVNATSGNRPLVVLANLAGFDGSPESLRTWQLEYGAEIGRAIVNFEGPIVFCVVSRYHGGAFVVFSKTLNDNMEVAAVEGSRASVIGGAPAAAVVFAREVQRRAAAAPEVRDLEERLAEATGGERSMLLAELLRVRAEVRSRELGAVAQEFDRIHSVERALEVGSLQRIIPPSQLRPYLIDAVERGMARELARLT